MKFLMLLLFCGSAIAMTCPSGVSFTQTDSATGKIYQLGCKGLPNEPIVGNVYVSHIYNEYSPDINVGLAFFQGLYDTTSGNNTGTWVLGENRRRSDGYYKGTFGQYGYCSRPKEPPLSGIGTMTTVRMDLGTWEGLYTYLAPGTNVFRNPCSSGNPTAPLQSNTCIGPYFITSDVGSNIGMSSLLADKYGVDANGNLLPLNSIEMNFSLMKIPIGSFSSYIQNFDAVNKQFLCP